MSTKRLSAGLLGIVLVLGVVACGSSSKSSGSAATTTTTVKSSQNIAADQAAAETASLKLSDFPAGWTSSPSSSDSGGNDNQVKAQVAKCLGVPETSLSEAPVSVDSPDFSDSNNDTVSSTVNYRATAAEQDTSFNLFSGPNLPNCLGIAFSAAIDEEIKHPSSPASTLPAGVTLGQPTVSPMSFPQFGDKSVAYQVDIPIKYSGLNIDALVDFIFAVKGRAAANMSFESTGTAFPTDQEQHYTALVVNRLTNT